MNRLWIVAMIEILTGIAGFGLLWWAQGWPTALAVFFLMWSHNVALKARLA